MIHRPIIRTFSAACLALLLLAVPALADEAQGDAPPLKRGYQSFSITVENDFFGGHSDEHYTNGLRLAWASPDLAALAPELPDWFTPYLDLYPFLTSGERQHNITMALGQNLYTPQDTQATELQEDDRPYAALGYFTLGLVSKDPWQMDGIETTLGMVGPAALGEEVQNSFHQLISDDTAKGWDNQLENEPAVMVSWQHIWRLTRQDLGADFGLDLLPHVGASLGNIETGARIGGEARLGWNLPLDFGTGLLSMGNGVSAPAECDQDDGLPEQDPTDFYGFHLFAGWDMRYVAHTIFLDGNTFADSHSVDKLPFVNEVYAGASLLVGPAKLTYTLVHRTDEFKGQEGGQTYGSLNLTLTF